MRSIRSTLRRALAVALLILLFAGMARAEAVCARPDAYGKTGVALRESRDRLFETYASCAFGLDEANAFRVNRAGLTDLEKQVYDEVTVAVKQIADGERADTIITIPFRKLGLKTTWTQSELGIRFIVNGKGNWDGIEEALEAVYAEQYDVDRVLNALWRDDPYEFYWMSYQDEIWYTTPWICACSVYNGKLTLSGGISFKFPVDALYAGSELYTANTRRTGAVRTAVDNAAAILDEAESMGDLEKMTFFMQRIRALSDYDYDAVEGPIESAAPWQLVYVFDGDPETKVVCEGYSKAFQYLCDNADFADESILVYSVTGVMSDPDGEGGGHMWNIVRMGDVNYLVDVTNCRTDGGTVDSLFFSAPLSGDPDEGYVMRLEDGYRVSFLYTYDDNYYGYDRLSLANEITDVTLTLAAGDAIVLRDETLGYPPMLNEVEPRARIFADAPGVVDLEGGHVLRALRAGEAKLRLVGGMRIVRLTVEVVEDMDTVALPKSAIEIGAEALSGVAVERLILPGTLKELATDAFAGIPTLRQIVVPSGLPEKVLSALPAGDGLLCLCGDAKAALAVGDAGGDYVMMAE